MLLEGDCFVDQFTEARSPIAARMALAEKVEVQHDPAITAEGSKFRHMVRVEVHLQRRHAMQSDTCEAPRGSETDFASEADIVAKFVKLATHAVPTPAAERIVDLVLHLERVQDSRELVRALARAPVRPAVGCRLCSTFPSPRRGGVRGGVEHTRGPGSSHPHPRPLPTRGRGARAAHVGVDPASVAQFG